MHKLILITAGAAALAACGQSADESGTNQAAANQVRPKKKPAYCFFKDAEMKGWAAKRGKDGNITVNGKAYRSDSRYQAVFGPAEISGTIAAIAPTIQSNSTGYGAPDNWWDVTATIPNSAAVETVTVRCGQKTVAELKVPAKG